MRFFPATFFLFLSLCLKAEVGVLFSENQATLLVQGKNTDAENLYEAMNVPSSSNNNVLTKKIVYTAMFANPVFEQICNKSLLTNSTSCSIKFFSPGAVLFKDKNAILMGINDQFDSVKIAKLFNQTSSNSYQAQVFLSEDEKLKIWKTYDSSGEVVNFTMSYN